ncbi:MULTISPECIES: NAD(+) synthase [Pseudobutyrivibrio]|jgi:NAD+ synthase|uniref:NH(3)-dependent NAD(+) synthetase n=1 Tax=Pseudobutyrivibrio xylanivorans TaxID=185007 RepID=A0A1G5RQN0_PSEXY|nr:MULTISPECIES: NAD(+) synthase [Pseudobutyrivibrio]MDC7278966.1 NAD(+) synthase [Butyrivibrio fibrisolvens]SCZ76405.1 NAD+ synthase [Pseudobutyrivibrio xylanivorans]
MREFDVEKQTKQLIEYTREWFNKFGENSRAVLGISGGKDSSVTAAVLKEALGADRVLGIIMPNGEMSDLDDAKLLVDFLKIPNEIVPITDYYNAAIATFEKAEKFEVTKDLKINLAPRLRMSTLYAVAQGQPVTTFVVNTCNASEDYVGYSTKFGDAAGDVSLLQDFTVTEVLQIGEYLGLPEQLVHKVPSDGLSGMSDEDKLGFKYAQLDEYISNENADIPADVKASIDRKHVANLHKLQLMPAYKRH